MTKRLLISFAALVLATGAFAQYEARDSSKGNWDAERTWIPAGEEDGGVTPPLELTNAQKLALPANTPVGTQVAVTDGFRLEGADDYFLATGIDGFWIQSGTENGKPKYIQAVPTDEYSMTYSPGDGGWYLLGPGDVYSVPGDEDYPWEADWSGASLTLMHPVVQELVSPSTEQVGAFVANGGDQLGIYTIPEAPNDVVDGKAHFTWLGESLDGEFHYVRWQNAGVGPTEAAGWQIGYTGGGPVFYSLSNTATPDLATDWKNASDNTPASIEVTSVTQGEIDAGVDVVGAGTALINGTYPNSIAQGASGSLIWDKDGAKVYNDLLSEVNIIGDDLYGSTTPGAHAFPWQAPAWMTYVGELPLPTVTRNDVASEANWEEVEP